MLRASPGCPSMATRPTHALDPWGLREKLAALLLSLHRTQALGLPSWQTRSAHAPSPVFHAPAHDPETPPTHYRRRLPLPAPRIHSHLDPFTAVTHRIWGLSRQTRPSSRLSSALRPSRNPSWRLRRRAAPRRLPSDFYVRPPKVSASGLTVSSDKVDRTFSLASDWCRAPDPRRSSPSRNILSGARVSKPPGASPGCPAHC